MRWRSYKRWGLKDPAKEDKYWLPETHPMYMEQARPILKNGSQNVRKVMSLYCCVS